MKQCLRGRGKRLVIIQPCLLPLPKQKGQRVIAMRSNLNVDIKFYADKVLDMLGNSLSKYTDKISGTKSGGSGGGRGQGGRGGGDGYGSGAQRKGGRRDGR